MTELILIFNGCTSTEGQKHTSVPISDHTDDYHGNAVPDPYRWMEEMDTKEVSQWVRRQDDALNDYMAEFPSRESIRKRINELTYYDLYDLPKVTREGFFFAKTDANATKPVIYYSNSALVADTVVLDGRVIFNDTTNFGGMSTGRSPLYWPSPSGSKLIYSMAKDQSRWFGLKIVDLKRQETFSEQLNGLHNSAASVVWDGDEGGFYYVRHELPKPGTELVAAPDKAGVYFHKLGTTQSKDILIYQDGASANMLYTLQATYDHRDVIVSTREGAKMSNSIHSIASKGNDFKVTALIQGDSAQYMFLGNEGKHFFFQTTDNAPNGKVITVHKDFPTSSREVIPEAAEAMSAGSLVGGNAIGFFGGKFVVAYTRNGIPFIKIFDAEGVFEKSVNLPTGGSLWGGFSGRADQKVLYFQFLGLADASSIYSMDVQTGKIKLFRQSNIPNLDPASFEVRHVTYSSKDGTAIPMFLAYKKGTRIDGQSAAFMYAYGQFGWVSFMWYQPHIVAFLEMGGIFAQPSIRGGGEFGQRWHAAGSGLNAQNSVDDYIAAAEWLISNNYTKAQLLVANGGSASGPTVGAVINQRPDLFGAAVIDRPALDMLRFHEFTAAHHWVKEFGSPEIEDEFHVLRKLSPYHNIDSNKKYPSLLIMAGDKDEVTPPFHSYKYVARMQALQEDRDNPVLLKMMWGAGHNFGATPQTRSDSRTDEISFIMNELGMAYPQPVEPGNRR